MKPKTTPDVNYANKDKKYALIKSDKTTPDGKPLFRVKALIDFSITPPPYQPDTRHLPGLELAELGRRPSLAWRWIR